MTRAVALAAVLLAGCPDGPSDYVSTDPTKGCERGGNCKFECGSSPCAPTCGAGSNCLVECGSSVCSPSCAAGAECTIECASGLCEPACTGACTIRKGSGTVQCSGQGCP